MDKHKQIIIIILIIILVSILTYIGYTIYNQNNITYQRVEIVPNATSIEIPVVDAKYLNDTNGVKFWNWSNGVLISYNSQEGVNNYGLSGALGFYAIKELIHSGESETVDGFTIYKLSADKLSNILKTNTNKEFYCIHVFNDTTHDNIIICCENKEIALHMAKSIIYKTVNVSNQEKSNSINIIHNNIQNNSNNDKLIEEEHDYYSNDDDYYDDEDYSYTKSSYAVTTTDTSSSSGESDVELSTSD